MLCVFLVVAGYLRRPVSSLNNTAWVMSRYSIEMSAKTVLAMQQMLTLVCSVQSPSYAGADDDR